MRAYVRYYNKPHDLRLSHIHVVLLARGIWWVSCDLSVRGYEISSTGGSSVRLGRQEVRSHQTYFGDDGGIRAALILRPQAVEEGTLGLVTHNIYKCSYHAVLVSSRLLGRKWEEHCRASGRNRAGP